MATPTSPATRRYHGSRRTLALRACTVRPQALLTLRFDRAMLNLLGFAIAFFMSGAPATASSLPLSQVTDLPLPGHASRFDYQWLDSTNRRLYIAHLGDSSLVVFDLDGQRVIHEVSGLPSVHGVVA